ncbi:MAG: alkaline phosphatase [Panacagrimonas sp.]|nr:alkaline phosphatase [Panacagrimonas sp.]MCC2654974.1 alkaline phosphatase [Panacagrimonas sp.]
MHGIDLNCRRALTVAAAVFACGVAAAQSAPVVQGPESVDDWRASGERFLKQARAAPKPRIRAKNVILFVGDGMGISTVTAARILEGQRRGAPGEENRLSFEEFPHVALSKTYSWDQQTSDSAPTITALITGYKARDGMLSVDHRTPRWACDAELIRSHALRSLLERAAAAGRATGIVTTARLTHATPAATYAHTAVRDWENDAEIRRFEARRALPPGSCTVKDIAAQLIELAPPIRASLRVALGGGRAQFLPASAGDPEDGPERRGLRADGRDLMQEWIRTRGAGARVATDSASFASADDAKTRFLLGLFERSHMEYESDRSNDKGGEPSLTQMTERAIRMLAAEPKGYFLQVEAGRIDHGHHAGNAYRALGDAIELSNAVRRATELTRVEDTLIIVTADHSHTFVIAGYPHRGNPILGKVSPVPDVDGEPPGPALDLQQRPYTTLGYANGPGHSGKSDRQPAGPKRFPHQPMQSFSDAPRPDLRAQDTEAADYLQESLVPLQSETHGGEDVAVFARGPSAHLVHGVMEQHWVYYVMREALGLDARN